MQVFFQLQFLFSSDILINTFMTLNKNLKIVRSSRVGVSLTKCETVSMNAT